LATTPALCELRGEPRTREFAELAERLFTPALDHLFRLKGRDPRAIQADLRDDILHEACVGWLERLAGGWRPPPPGPERDQCFLRLVGRSHYRIARSEPQLRRTVLATSFVTLDEDSPLVCGGEAPDGPMRTRELLATLRRLPFASDRLLSALALPTVRRRTFPRVRTLAANLDLQVRAVRRQMHALMNCAGRGSGYVDFGLRRAGEAAFELARRLLGLQEHLRLVQSGESTGEETLRRRLRRVLERLARAARDDRQRRTLLLLRSTLRAAGDLRTRITRALDAAQAVFGATPAILLGRAETARAAGQPGEMRRFIDAAGCSVTPRTARLVALARARAAESAGSFAEAARQLEAPAFRSPRDAVVLYGRVALSALAQVQARPWQLLLEEVQALSPGERTRFRQFLATDGGPFGRLLRDRERLRRQVLSRLA
jgi:hypothetical protein